MAVRTRLTGRRRLLLVVVIVLLAHGVALRWIARLQLESSLLQPMAPTMYTRLLTPQAPPPPPAVAAPAPAPPRRAARHDQLQAAASVPRTATPTIAAPPAPEPKAAAEAATPALPEPEPSAPSTDVTAAPAEPAASSPPGTETASTEPAADSWPVDTRLRYRLGGRFRSGDLYGNARVLWQREAQRYQVRVEVEVTFWAKLVMTSQGEVTGSTLAPQVYQEVRNGKPRGLRIGEREVLLANGQSVPRPPHVQDTASQFVELSHRFASGQEPLDVGRAVSVWMARPGAVDLWIYDIVGSEVLRTPLGDIEAFHLKPRPIANPRGNITAEMWFAPSLQYLPVRIRVRMGEEAEIDLLVDAIDQR